MHHPGASQLRGLGWLALTAFGCGFWVGVWLLTVWLVGCVSELFGGWE